MEFDDTKFAIEFNPKNKIQSSLARNVMAASSLAYIIRSSLGPNGLAKMIIDEHSNVVITADGASILRSLKVSDPFAQLIVQASLAQELSYGDGTSSVPVIAAQLLEEALYLTKKGIDPMKIVLGYNKALSHVTELLNEFVVHELNDFNDPTQVKEAIYIALSSKQTQQIDFLTELLTRTVCKVMDKKRSASTTTPSKFGSVKNEFQARCHTDSQRVPFSENKFKASDITVVLSPGRELTASHMVDGIIVPGVSMTRVRECQECAIAFVMHVDDGTRSATSRQVTFRTTDQLKNFKSDEESAVKKHAEKLRSLGVNVLLVASKLSDLAIYYLNSIDIVVLDQISLPQFSMMSQAAGATPKQSIMDLTIQDLGKADQLAVKTVSGRECSVLTGLPYNDKVSLIIHGTTPQNCEEIHRSIDDALQTLRALSQNDPSVNSKTKGRGRLVLGGGCIEFNLSMRMLQMANEAEGIEQFIFHSYAESLLSVPKVLSGNAGSDSDVTVHDLIQFWNEKCCDYGVNERGQAANMKQLRIYDVLAAKQSVFHLATTVACTILKICETVKKSDQRSKEVR
jgi:chaperonin GroEL (HSP60 family)